VPAHPSTRKTLGQSPLAQTPLSANVVNLASR
jgi:hypothetical protein